MTTVSIDKALLDELVDCKLSKIEDQITQSLRKWGYDSADQFLADVVNGILSDADEDAAAVTNLVEEQKILFQLKKSQKGSLKRKKLSEYYDGLLEDEFQALTIAGKNIKEEIRKTRKY